MARGRRGLARGALGRLRRLLRRALLAGAVLLAAALLLLRWVDPPTTWLIETERARLGDVAHAGAPLANLPPLVRLAFPAAEDARFCAHWGLDPEALRTALAEAEAGRRLRGASTISQQVVKNVFLWPGRSWLRKGLEAVLAPLAELAWGKRRMLELYLSVAEMGEGVFGLGAAAQAHFGKPASALTAAEAARIAAGLPSPRTRDPARPTAAMRRRAAAIVQGAETLEADGRGACVL